MKQSKIVKKAIPFSFMHVVRHTNDELTFSTKPFLVEGVATIVDDPEDNLPAKISPDIDRVFVGQEEVKTELHLQYGHINPLKKAAFDHIRKQIKNDR